ncbi:hypothetical protein M0R19_08915 [Candidatus Pacearchaeota archaeon]|jgi:hypothetical protein|nr:hypothetical protein [bacterium]MCK9597280.1 hypothetical protein [Candidatus Pacearchaeota archaeon]
MCSKTEIICRTCSKLKYIKYPIDIENRYIVVCEDSLSKKSHYFSFLPNENCNEKHYIFNPDEDYLSCYIKKSFKIKVIER